MNSNGVASLSELEGLLATRFPQIDSKPAIRHAFRSVCAVAAQRYEIGDFLNF